MSTKHTPMVEYLLANGWMIAPGSGHCWIHPGIQSSYGCTFDAVVAQFANDAEQIVRAVNAHEALLDALQECTKQIVYLRANLSAHMRRFTTPTTDAALEQAHAAIDAARKDTT